MTRREDDLELFLNHPGLSRVNDNLARMARNSIRIRTRKVNEESIAIGASKFGGTPDLPPGLEWPMNMVDLSEMPPGLLDDVNSALLDSGGRYHLPFVAQFRLDDVAPYDLEDDLPSTGMLYFYGDPSEHFGIRASQWFWSKNRHRIPNPNDWKVIYHKGDLRDLTRARVTQALPDNRTFGTCTLTFWSASSLPQVETCFIGAEVNQEAMLVLTDKEWDIYSRLRHRQYVRKSVHKLLGYSDDSQPFAMEWSYSLVRDKLFPNPLPFDSLSKVEQQVELVEGRLLFQLDGLLETNMWFGRGGNLFFFIRQDDLIARDFSKAWATEQ
jgi:uncharacterized protein YwqG